MFEDKVLIIELLAPSATVVREIVALAHELEMMWWKLLPLKPQPFSRVHRQRKFSGFEKEQSAEVKKFLTG